MHAVTDNAIIKASALQSKAAARARGECKKENLEICYFEQL